MKEITVTGSGPQGSELIDMSNIGPHSTRRILNAIHSTPWLITAGAFDQIIEIANRANTLTPEMVSEYKGKKSGRENMVTMFDDTAVLDITGPVFRYANLFTMFSGATSTESVSSELGRLKADDKVKRIVTRYDCPGGMANGAAETSTQFQNIDKPLIAFATGQACSLAYFWASQGNSVIVAEDAMVGCIGTRAPRPVGKTDDDIVSRHAPAKIINEASMQGIVDSLEDVFHKHVAHGRGVSVDHVIEHFGQGGVFIGQQAVDAGLADSTGTLDSILGGNHVATFAVRKRANQPSQQKETLMSGDNETGGAEAANNEQAVKDARAEGVEAGKVEARAETETAVQAETDRCVAILNAGQSKPMSSVLPLLKNRAIDAQGAADILAGIPDSVAPSGLSNQMNGSNPNISNDEPNNSDEGDTSANVWDSHSKGDSE